ncbi:hypothetical protein [uncultured Kriegella sp.]|uniref:3D domain-containing protein n=1 Tax=uncultured Kriegella sp. TaxID=1798910 RepID=UPI0030D87C6D|tara:strand:- start:137619 stop:138023 length:405 start_codon:yes stop_codon:yes gene_type:complete
MGLSWKRIWGLLVLVFIVGCHDNGPIWKPLEVTVSAYNSVKSQTANNPRLAAWGDTLVPGEKSIAVSQDLIALGLGHMTKVRIEGLQGVYKVKDKMHGKWKNRIDIYMGNDIKQAKAWGIKKKVIYYAIEQPPE